MRLIPFTLNGTDYHLLLNGAALFDIYDQFGYEGSVADHIKGKDREGFENICWYLEELATQGELFRREQGFDKGPVPSAKSFMVALSPLDVPRARTALQDAIYAGFSMEEGNPPKEIDKGLLELQKKTETV